MGYLLFLGFFVANPRDGCWGGLEVLKGLAQLADFQVYQKHSHHMIRSEKS